MLCGQEAAILVWRLEQEMNFCKFRKLCVSCLLYWGRGLVSGQVVGGRWCVTKIVSSRNAVFVRGYGMISRDLPDRRGIFRIVGDVPDPADEDDSIMQPFSGRASAAS